MEPVSRRGFTLIELLTVIAIIAILASITAVALPRVLEKARIARTEADMKQVATALTQYMTEHNSFPPAYGFKLWPPQPENDPSYVPQFRHTAYVADINLLKVFDVYDYWSESHDTNGDKQISYLEFSPIDGRDCTSLDTELPFPLDPAAALCGNQGKQMNEKRPFAYIPYFSKHLDRLKKRLAATYQTEPYPLAWLGETWAEVDNDPSQPLMPSQMIPPPRYDGFVLLSVGPENNSHGILVPPGPSGDAFDEAFFGQPSGSGLTGDMLYILGLRAAFLGTRDANDNGNLDFDFRARTRSKEGRDEGWVLPDRSAQGGPLLLKY
ncbi:MAG: prepilin-type N-terminal cleavage/methylation domain-containing protein [Candidatus Hydrogenedentes bacterium]|nr:prepilin-type N-terminal cleavage/methylation domain-containing protein [Candidatus Hydrogenedentota bacterium]